MNPTKLLDFVQSKLMVPLDRDDEEKLLSAKITGSAFLYAAGDAGIFEKAGISLGPSIDLAQLAKTVIDSENPTSSKFYLINLINS